MPHWAPPPARPAGAPPSKIPHSAHGSARSRGCGRSVPLLRSAETVEAARFLRMAEQIGVGMLGCGFIGMFHSHALRSLCPCTDQTRRRTRSDSGCRYLRVGPPGVQLAVRMGRERIGLAVDRLRSANRVCSSTRRPTTCMQSHPSKRLATASTSSAKSRSAARRTKRSNCGGRLPRPGSFTSAPSSFDSFRPSGSCAK